LLLENARQLSDAYRDSELDLNSSDEQDQGVQADLITDNRRELIQRNSGNPSLITPLGQNQSADVENDLGPLGLANRALLESVNARTALEQLLQDPSAQGVLNF